MLPPAHWLLPPGHWLLKPLVLVPGHWQLDPLVLVPGHWLPRSSKFCTAGMFLSQNVFECRPPAPPLEGQQSLGFLLAKEFSLVARYILVGSEKVLLAGCAWYTLGALAAAPCRIHAGSTQNSQAVGGVLLFPRAPRWHKLWTESALRHRHSSPCGQWRRAGSGSRPPMPRWKASTPLAWPSPPRQWCTSAFYEGAAPPRWRTTGRRRSSRRQRAATPPRAGGSFAPGAPPNRSTPAMSGTRLLSQTFSSKMCLATAFSLRRPMLSNVVLLASIAGRIYI